jgi:WD40 repeat protein/tRNA A-37 threonylcarbamoyl transferase component Bud32
LSPSQFSRLSELLDESIEMTPEERLTWLADLERNDPDSAAVLRGLFTAQGACQAEGFLETRDLVARHVASMAQANPGLTGRQFGPYRVQSLLGNGGMGSVWLAERIDGLFTRQVALKLVHPALMGRVMTERVAREREILASLNHPNIARLLDAGFAEDGQPYLALEYVAGTPITTYCDEHRLTIRERLELFRQVLSAAQYAHAHLVIHRDLKPSNILVTEDGQIHLLDFGIAKLLTAGEAKETELTQLGGRALTPDYAAPEQIAGAPITTAADVYALGVMFYELLTGERPYRPKRDSRGALEEAILQEDPVEPSRVMLTETTAHARTTTVRKLAKALKGDLDTIANKAMKKSPIERYATVDAFGEDIARYLRGDVVLAQRDSVAYRALKFARRNRAVIAAASVLIITLAGGLAATSYEARVASTQRDATLQAQLRSLTQTAAARLGNADISGAQNIILEVLPHRGANRSFTPEALSVFQQARATDAQVLALTGHTGKVRSAAFSPDGRRVVTASWDRTARIWDAATGREVLRLSGHTDRVWSASFSPDGMRAITASHDKTARIWDASTGQQILLLSGHQDRVTSAAFSPDGRRVITASYDKTARIWDAATGQQTLVLSGHTDLVMYAAFSPDGKQVVTASHDKTARIWDATTGRQIRLLSGHTDWVITAAFSPDGLQVVTASHDKTAGIWDSTTGRQIRLLSGHTDRLWFAAFSPDGRHVSTASFDKTARIWDAATGRELMRLSGHNSEVVGAALSPDGRRLVTASYDSTARVWDADMSRETTILTGHEEPVACASFSPDGLRVVTGSNDKTARIWDAATGRELIRLSGHTDQVVSAAFSPDGLRVVTGSPDKTARIWDAATGRELMRLSGHTDQVVGTAFSPDGRRVVTASLDKTARIWDSATGRELMLLKGHTDLVETADFSHDGQRIVTASQDKTARIWDASTGREIMVLSGHTERLESAAFSHDGRHIVTASADKTARIWDAVTGRQLVLLSGHADLVEIAAFSPDGRRVVTASDDKTARIWDAETGREIKLLSGHTDRLWFAAYSPDGQRVVTASDDKTARIWDARAPTLEVQIGWAQAAQFDPLPSVERFQLGLPSPTDVRQWPTDASKCDETAAAPYDPDRRAPGFTLDHLVSDIAEEACAKENSSSRDRARSIYQQGRALMASGNFAAASRDFEDALAHGYRAASVDLAVLLSRSFSVTPDVLRAISLYEQAWNGGVTVAAFELGSLYEHGVNGAHEHEYVLAPDEARAWFWYQKAADVGEPNALARFADKADGASALEAFKYYAAAAERARSEDWPDDIWRNWRYRRASLARLLARQGMMQEVAEVYDGVRKQYAAPQ